MPIPFENDHWKLVFKDTGTPVTLGMDVLTFRKEWAKVQDAEPPRHSASTGRVTTDLGSHYPSVYGMEWVRKEPL